MLVILNLTWQALFQFEILCDGPLIPVETDVVWLPGKYPH